METRKEAQLEHKGKTPGKTKRKKVFRFSKLIQSRSPARAVNPREGPIHKIGGSHERDSQTRQLNGG